MDNGSSGGESVLDGDASVKFTECNAWILYLQNVQGLHE